MSVKDRLKNQLKRVRLVLDDEEINTILKIDRIEYLNLSLLTKVIKNVKDNDQVNITDNLYRLRQNMLYDNNNIDEFIKELDADILIDKGTLEMMLSTSDRPTVLRNVILYTNALQSIDDADIFRMKDLSDEKNHLYLADAIRYTKRYMNYAYDFTTFE